MNEALRAERPSLELLGLPVTELLRTTHSHSELLRAALRCLLDGWSELYRAGPNRPIRTS